jgi:serine/threonine protein kinase/Tol biopolymer transport system component
MIGQAIAHYRVTARIGAGGMGMVYLATDTRLDRQVAIKALPEHLANDADRLARFQREAKVLASLNHPNIGAIHGLEEANGQQYLVLEYIEGEPLDARISRGPLLLEDAIEVAVHVAGALEAAHEKGVIHRDLKPGNIMVTPAGTVKVLDFGLARMTETTSSLSTPMDEDSPTMIQPDRVHSPTMPGVILGTAGYMSPEQARGKPVDKRSDIFSFGCVLYEMLTGVQAFGGETVADSIGATLHKDVDLNRLPPSTPQMVRHVLRRCLERDKRKRLRDIGDARLELESTDDPMSTSVAAPPRRRVNQVLAAIAVVSILASVATILWLRPTIQQPVRRFEIPLRGSQVLFGNTGAISPDGAAVAYVVDGALWLRPMDAIEARKIADEASPMQPFWSPDGLWVGFAQGQSLMRAAVVGGQTEKISGTPHTMSITGGGAWLPDGRIFFTTGAGGLFETKTGIGSWKEVSKPPDGVADINDGAALPDGRGILLTEHPPLSPFRLAVWDGRVLKTLLAIEGSNLSSPVYSETGHLLFERSDLDGWDAGIWAMPFSLNRLEVTGTPFMVAAGGGKPTLDSHGTLVYSRGGSGSTTELGLVEIDTGKVTILSSGRTDLVAPRFSSDGKHIVYTERGARGSDLWLLNLGTGAASRFTFDRRHSGGIWSPDGSQIATQILTASARERSKWSIGILATDGSGQVRTEVQGSQPTFDAKWSVMVFTRYNEETKSDIWYMPLEGENEPKTLIATPAFERMSALSPDGNWLAYSVEGDMWNQLFLTRFPSAVGKWQVSPGMGLQPRWSNDGKRLYFVDLEKGLQVVDLDLAAGVQISPPRAVFKEAVVGAQPNLGYDIDSSGKRVLLPIAPPGSTSRSIVIVENWYESFRNQPR